ncbi:hypothetical protein SKAU_G00077450 [Synaphobranchus kaupii]|uniref:Uncharacterized protein n=1 Tax=Synaphobranchus kaupii TaxID=118154 RepID=A0A9Q1G9J9_SYNKA|nr:hypothetical protein SKAU_G00077450 [Synaphobranchus kaupii]
MKKKLRQTQKSTGTRERQSLNPKHRRESLQRRRVATTHPQRRFSPGPRRGWRLRVVLGYGFKFLQVNASPTSSANESKNKDKNPLISQTLHKIAIFLKVMGSP